jgi:hypothetical protein
MLNDFYPEKRAHWTRIQQYVSEMVEEVRAAGYTNVHYFAHTPIGSEPFGEDWHPTAERHQKMADELEDFLRLKGLL